MQRKFRAHFQFIVKQKKHAEAYGVNRIRAVLVESIEDHWTRNLRNCARYPIVSGKRPSPLFWFTTSDLVFERTVKKKIKSVERNVPVYLEKPELVFAKIWATAADEEEDIKLQSIIE